MNEERRIYDDREGLRWVERWIVDKQRQVVVLEVALDGHAAPAAASMTQLDLARPRLVSFRGDPSSNDTLEPIKLASLSLAWNKLQRPSTMSMQVHDLMAQIDVKVRAFLGGYQMVKCIPNRFSELLGVGTKWKVGGLPSPLYPRRHCGEHASIPRGFTTA